jgi:ATP-dependent Clp protease ATP-binding subunit ClpA
MHRRDDVQRVPADLREGPRAVRRFQKVDVPEPSIAETIEILKGLKSRFEQHHGVKYAPAALTTAASSSRASSTTVTCPTRRST